MKFVDKLRKIARDKGMLDWETANVGAVIGFIVMAVIMGIGVVKKNLASECKKAGHISRNPLSGGNRHPDHRQQLRVVLHAEHPCVNHAERIRSARDHPDSHGRRCDPRNAVRARTSCRLMNVAV